MFADKPTQRTFINESTNETLVFDQREFLHVTFEVIVHYLRYHSDYAQDLIMDSILYGKISDYFSAKSIAHYSEYHWAMLLAHGHKYWQEGFNIEEPSDYRDFKQQVIAKHQLLMSDSA